MTDTDYESLVASLRGISKYRAANHLDPSVYDTAADAVETLRANRRDAYRMVQEANDDVRTLLAERDALREANGELERQIQGWVRSATDAKDAERALQAQLDNMTTEWGTKIISEPGVDVGTEDYARRNVAQWNLSTRHRGDMRGVVVKRLVGPWVEVTD